MPLASKLLSDQLERQLSTLKRQGVIETWHDRRTGAGQEFDKAIDGRMNTDDIILLLANPDFIDSDYCYELEMQRALERHEAGAAIVIPVILRACDRQPFPAMGSLSLSDRTETRRFFKWLKPCERQLEEGALALGPIERQERRHQVQRLSPSLL